MKKSWIRRLSDRKRKSKTIRPPFRRGFRPSLEPLEDRALLAVLTVLLVWLGVYPAPVFDATAASVDLLVNNYAAALQAAQDVALSAQ